MSGFTLGHSDIGGYTTVDYIRGIASFKRSQELLFRWIEMNAFSDMIMRTHVGSKPEKMAQLWDNDETIEHFTKFVNIHKMLKPYKMDLMENNKKTGLAPIRPLMFEFEDDENTWDIKDQFMLGSKYLMAPVFKAKATKRDFYLPKGTWTHFFNYDVIKSEG